MADKGVLDELIDEVISAAENRKNRTSSKSRKPGTASFFVALEEPIAWTILEGLDVNRYFQDPFYYAEHSLKHKLWRSRHVDDCTAVTADLPLWLGHYPEYTFFDLEVTYNVRGLPAIREDHPLRSRPDINLLLRFITDQRNRWHESRWSFLGRQREPAEIGDDWVNIPFISPQMFEEFVLPRYLEIERQLRSISERCEGRSYDVSTSGLTPVTNSARDFIETIHRFTDVAHRIWSG